MYVCLSVCSCLNAGLTAGRINLIFGMHILIWSDCAIGYMILIFEVIKDHFRPNLWVQVIRPSIGNRGRGPRMRPIVWTHSGPTYHATDVWPNHLDPGVDFLPWSFLKFWKSQIVKIVSTGYFRILGRLLFYKFASAASKFLVYIYIYTNEYVRSWLHTHLTKFRKNFGIFPTHLGTSWRLPARSMTKWNIQFLGVILSNKPAV